jgi:putative DNA methylase
VTSVNYSFAELNSNEARKRADTLQARLQKRMEELQLESKLSPLTRRATQIFSGARNKAMIEIPPKFAGKPPVNPQAQAEKRLVGKTWRSAHYPQVEITAEMAKERPDLKPLV